MSKTNFDTGVFNGQNSEAGSRKFSGFGILIATKAQKH